MALTKERKNELIQAFRINDEDTGSPEIQVAVLTERITELTEHLKEHKHDYSTRRGLIKMVGRRRKLLRYLYNNHSARYVKIIQTLGLKREDVKVARR